MAATTTSGFSLPWDARAVAQVLRPVEHPQDSSDHTHPDAGLHTFMALLDDNFRAIEDHLWTERVASQTFPAAATDLASVITLANGLRTALINLGLGH